MIKKIEVRKAEICEVNIALSLLKGAARWLCERGINYWQHWHDPSPEFLSWLEDGFCKKQIYYVFTESKIIGMFRLQWSDEMFWGKQKDDAGYIHLFTVDRIYYGQGVGKLILTNIESMCKEHGKKYLRLDCGVNINKLCKYYEENGFIEKGIVELFGERLKLHEKQLIP